MAKTDYIKRRVLENSTLASVKEVSPHLYMIDYKYPYRIDAMLEKGVNGMLDLALFAQKELKTPLPISPLPMRFGCSAFNAVNAKNEPIMGRNFDYKESDCFVLWTSPKNGYRSISTGTLNFLIYGIKHMRLETAKRPLRLLAAPYVPMDGMNEKGLAIAILEIKAKPTKQQTGKPPIIPPIAVRAVLDKCANVGEAVELFSRYDMRDLIGVNYHYFVSDAIGASVIIEYIDNEMHVISQSKPGESQVLTNHFIFADGDNTKGRGFERRKNISCALMDEASLSEAKAMSLLGSNTLFYRHPRFRHMVITVWSNVFNLKNRTQLMCSNMDYESIFRFSLYKPLKAELVNEKLVINGGKMHD